MPRPGTLTCPLPAALPMLLRTLFTAAQRQHTALTGWAERAGVKGETLAAWLRGGDANLASLERAGHALGLRLQWAQADAPPAEPPRAWLPPARLTAEARVQQLRREHYAAALERLAKAGAVRVTPEQALIIASLLRAHAPGCEARRG